MTADERGRLIDALTLEPTAEPSTFRAAAVSSAARPPTAAVYGGQLVAQALLAAARAVPSERAVHSVHGHFLSRGDTGQDLDYVVEPLREGSAQSVVSVTARQGERDVFHLVASFAAASEGPAHQLSVVSAPPPEELPDPSAGTDALDPASAAWLRTLAAAFPIDLRFVGEPPRVALNRGAQVEPQVTTWVRTTDPLPADPMLHAAAAAYISDLFLLATSLAPHGLWIGDPGVTAMSLDHAIWFHAPVRADDWLLYDRHGLWSGYGRALSRGTLTDRDGRLVATVMQEGLVRHRPGAAPTETRKPR